MEGGDVILGSARVKRTGLDGTQKHRERLGGNPLAPESPSDPVGHFEFSGPGSYKGTDVACDLPAKKNGPIRGGIVAKYLGPFGHECRSVRRIFGRKRGHTVGGRVPLLLEEDRKVTFGHIPQ